MAERDELASLRARLAAAEAECDELRLRLASAARPDPSPRGEAEGWVDCGHGLSAAQLSRYGRHVVLPSVGAVGQGRLARARALVVGLGGLGSPAALYLAAAGVGTLGLADGDVVELANLQRQLAFCERDVGRPKAAAAAAACAARNGAVRLLPLPAVSAENARQLLAGYDLVLDCTDSPLARAALSDAAAALRLPLVCGAALGTEGQVSVLCGAGGPCRRCLWPNALAAPAGRCADAGVLGPLVGVVGALQAVEAVKLLARGAGEGGSLEGRLLCYDALSSERPFYCVALPPRRADCPACGAGGEVQPQPQPRPQPQPQPRPPPQAAAGFERLTVAQLRALRTDGAPHLLVDVRPKHLFDACALAGSLSLPFREGGGWPDLLAAACPPSADAPRLVLLCRRGRASALAAAAAAADGRWPGVADVEGGLTAWRREIDPSFPEQQEC